MKCTIAGLYGGLLAVAVAARETGRPIIRLSARAHALHQQRREMWADQGVDMYPHRVWSAIKFLEDKRGFEAVPVIQRRPRARTAEFQRIFVDNMGAC